MKFKIQFKQSSLMAVTFLSGILLISIPQLSWSAAIETEFYTIEPFPLLPSVSTFVSLSVEPLGASMEASVNQVQLDIINRTVNISVDFSFFAGLVIPSPPEPNIPIGFLSNSGEYQFSLYEEAQTDISFFKMQNLIGTFDLLVTDANLTATPEVPAEGSIQSGIGLIQGWACDATAIEIQFDDEPKVPVAYGSSREDTRAICGDANNGYGMVMAWGLLTKGSHRMKTFIDGAEVSDVTFDVNGLDDAFITGLSHTQEIQNFPAQGESVTIQWSEPAQNFIIIEHNN